VAAVSESKDIYGVMTSVMQIVPELQERCGEPASLKVGSIGTFVAEDIIEVMTPAMQIVPKLHDNCGEPSLVIPKEMPVTPLSPLLEPNPPMDRGVLDATVTHSPMTIGQVVSLSDGVDEIDASASDSEALFAKELCDLLITLESACPGSGKEIVDILTGKDSRDIIKKVKKSLKSKCKKSDRARKVSAAA
jgi:hypothetical protein